APDNRRTVAQFGDYRPFLWIAVATPTDTSSSRANTAGAGTRHAATGSRASVRETPGARPDGRTPLDRHGLVHLETLGPPVSEVTLAGPIDCVVGSSARKLLSAIREADCPTHFDAGAVTFIDASGLRVIVELGFCNGHRPVIFDPPPILRFLLSATGMDQA